jgi:tRNA threonylcarbamoyladenosine biosynthesis protein TsaE
MIVTKNTADTHSLALDFVNNLLKTCQIPSAKATVVGLYGDLGSGKTSFVQGIAKAFGVNDYVISPTFVLQKRYEIDLNKQKCFSNLIHIDAYRMESAEELNHIKWNDLLDNPENIICIEWPERVYEKMPDNHIQVVCTFIDKESRGFDIRM